MPVLQGARAGVNWLIGLHKRDNRQAFSDMDSGAIVRRPERDNHRVATCSAIRVQLASP